jgi:hypothetical protein
MTMDDMTEAMRSDIDEAQLKSQIADLKRDLAAITLTLKAQGATFIDSLGDDTDNGSTFDHMKERGARAAHVLGHQAKRIAETPTQNSISTLMIIAGLGVVIGMLARS